MEFVVVSTGPVTGRGKYVGSGGSTRSSPFNETASVLPLDIDETWTNAFEMVLSFKSHADLKELGKNDVEQDESLRFGIRGSMPLVENYFGVELEWHASIHRDTDNPHIHITYRMKDGGSRGLSRQSFHNQGDRPSEIAELFLDGFGQESPARNTPGNSKKFIFLDQDIDLQKVRREKLEQLGWIIRNIEELPNFVVASDAAQNPLEQILNRVTKYTDDEGGASQVILISSNKDLRDATRDERSNWFGIENPDRLDTHLRLEAQGRPHFPQYIPETLKLLTQWNGWVRGMSYDSKIPKPTKIAFNVAKNWMKARSNQPGDWNSFEKAVQFVEGREKNPTYYHALKNQILEKIGGLSFQLRQGDNLVGIDLDKCLNPDTGEINQVAKDIVTRLGGYWEISPSGKGLRGFVIGEAIHRGKGKDEFSWIEVYDWRSPRYLTVTGNRLPGTELEPTESVAGLHWLYETYLKRPEIQAETQNRPSVALPERKSGSVIGDTITDEMVIDRLLKTRDGGKFLDLYGGGNPYRDSSGAEDVSTNDVRFVGMLAFYTQDRTQIDRIFRNSGRMRPKWDRSVGSGAGQSFGEYTISYVLRTKNVFFDWSKVLKPKTEVGHPKAEKPESALSGAPPATVGSNRNFKADASQGVSPSNAREEADQNPFFQEPVDDGAASPPAWHDEAPFDLTDPNDFLELEDEFEGSSGKSNLESSLFDITDRRILNKLAGYAEPEEIEADPNHVVRLWNGEAGVKRVKTKEGKPSTEPSQPAPPGYGDYLLARKLAFYSDDAVQIERLMRQSKRVRPEWDQNDWLKFTIDKALTMARGKERFNWGAIEEVIRQTISEVGSWELTDRIMRKGIEYLELDYFKDDDYRVHGDKTTPAFSGKDGGNEPENPEEAEKLRRIRSQQEELRKDFREVWTDKKADEWAKSQSLKGKSVPPEELYRDDRAYLRKLTRFVNSPEGLYRLFTQSKRMRDELKEEHGQLPLWKLVRKTLNRPHRMIDWHVYLMGKTGVKTPNTAKIGILYEPFQTIRLSPDDPQQNNPDLKTEKPAMNRNQESSQEGVVENAIAQFTGSQDTSITGNYRRGEVEKPSLADVIPAVEGPPVIDIQATEVRFLGSGNTNYRLPESEDFEYTPKVRFRNLIESLKVLNELRALSLEADGRVEATADQQRVLSLFPGFGAFPSELFTGRGEWKKESRELQNYLTPEEFASARSSHVNAMYTHPEVARAMWAMLEKTGITSVDTPRILEPSIGANGVLFATAPEAIQEKSIREGVELDSLSQEIASYLFPKDIIHKGNYGTANLPTDYYDIVIGNPPFGTGRLFAPMFASDPVVSKCPNHEVFMAKAINEMRPGGVMILVNSRYFMDKVDQKFRQWVEDRANLVKAFRLPSGAFQKNAGTQVITDILIFQKRGPGIEKIESSWLTTQRLEVNGEELADRYINQYFLDNPDQILGDKRLGHGMHGYDLIVEGQGELRDALKKAVEKVPALQNSVSDSSIPKRPPVILEEPSLPYLVEGGTLYRVTNEFGVQGKIATDHLLVIGKNGLEKKTVTREEVVRIGKLSELANTLRQVYQLDELGLPEAESERQKLQNEYRNFVSARGRLNTKQNLLLMSWHPDRSLLMSLESEGKEAGILKGPVSRRFEKGKIANVENAVLEAINTRQKLDPATIGKQLGLSEGEVLAELLDRKLAFRDPLNRSLVTSVEYLSGNVREKLKQAEFSARTMPEFEANVEALKGVLPPWRHYDEIPVRLGKPFIPTEYFERFIFEAIHKKYNSITGKVDRETIEISRNPHSGEWSVDSRLLGFSSHSDLKLAFGTDEAGWDAVLEAAFNAKQIVIKNEDGEINEAAMADIEVKIEKANEWFARWIWTGESGETREVMGTNEEIVNRRTVIEQIYNSTMNSIVQPKFTGEGMTFAGLATDIDPRAWTLPVVQEILHRRASLVTRDVGGGKTGLAALTVSKLQEIGAVEKGIIVCKKTNLAQFVGEIQRFFPGKRILTTSGLTDWTAKHATLMRGLTNDFDFVVMTYEDFSRIPIHPENFTRIVQDEIERVRQAYHEELETGSKFRTKQLERKMAEIEARISQRYFDAVKDNLYQFEPEQQSIIKVALESYENRAKAVANEIVSAAEHELKEILSSENRNGEIGKIAYSKVSEMKLACPEIKWSGAPREDARLNAKQVSSQAEEQIVSAVKYIALERTQYLEGIVKDSRIGSKMLTWERLIGRENIAFIADEVDDKVRGMAHPDASSAVRSIKGVPDGTGSDMAVDFRMKMSILYRQCVEGGANHRTVLMTATPIVNTAVEIFNWGKMLDMMPPGADNLQGFVNNFLRVSGRLERTMDGMKVQTRVRGYDSIPDLVRWAKSFVTFGPGTAADLNPPKAQTIVAVSPITEYEEFLLNEIAQKARNLGRDTTGERMRLVNELKQISVHTNLLYRDDIIPNPNGKIEMTADMIVSMASEYPNKVQLVFTDFGVHPNQKGISAVEDLIRLLEQKGIPKNKVLNFSNITGDEERIRAQQRLNDGDAIVAIGSTARLGTGTNVQKKVIAQYLLHNGYTPRNEIQCVGRGVRPGNENEAVQVVRVVKEGVDDFFAKYLGNKSEIISEFMGWVRSDVENAPMTFDVSEDDLTAEQIAAIASRDTLALQAHEKQVEVEALERKAKAFNRWRSTTQWEIASAERELRDLGEKGTRLNELTRLIDESETKEFEFSLPDGEVMSNKKEAGAYIVERQSQAVLRNESGFVLIGKYRGGRIASIEEYALELPQRILVIDFEGRQRHLIFNQEQPEELFRIANLELTAIKRELEKNASMKDVFERRRDTLRSAIYEEIQNGDETITRLKEFPQSQELEDARNELSELKIQINKRGDKRPELDGQAKIARYNGRDYVENVYRTGLTTSLYRNFVEKVRREKAGQASDVSDDLEPVQTTPAEPVAPVSENVTRVKETPGPQGVEAPLTTLLESRSPNSGIEPEPEISSQTPSQQRTNLVVLESPDKNLRILLGESRDSAYSGLQRYVVHKSVYDFITDTTREKFGRVNQTRTAVDYKSGWSARWMFEGESFVTIEAFKNGLVPPVGETSAAPANRLDVSEVNAREVRVETEIKSATPEVEKVEPGLPAHFIHAEGQSEEFRVSKIILVQMISDDSLENSRTAARIAKFLTPQTHSALIGVGDFSHPDSIQGLEDQLKLSPAPTGKTFVANVVKIGLDGAQANETGRAISQSGYGTERGTTFGAVTEYFADPYESLMGYALVTIRPLEGQIMETALAGKQVALQALRIREGLDEALMESFDEIETLLGGKVRDSNKVGETVQLEGLNGNWECRFADENYGQATEMQNFVFGAEVALELGKEVLPVSAQSIIETAKVLEVVPNQTEGERTRSDVEQPVQFTEGEINGSFSTSAETTPIPVEPAVPENEGLIVGFMPVTVIENRVREVQFEGLAEKLTAFFSKAGAQVSEVQKERLPFVLADESRTRREQAPATFEQMDAYFERRNSSINPHATLLDLRRQMVELGAKPESVYAGALKKAETFQIPVERVIVPKADVGPNRPLGYRVITDASDMIDGEDYRLVALSPRRVFDPKTNPSASEISTYYQASGTGMGKAVSGFLRESGYDVLRDGVIITVERESIVYEGEETFTKTDVEAEDSDIKAFGNDLANLKVSDPAFSVLRDLENRLTRSSDIIDRQSFRMRTRNDFISPKEIREQVFTFADASVERDLPQGLDIEKALARHVLIARELEEAEPEIQMLLKAAETATRWNSPAYHPALESCADPLNRRYARTLLDAAEKQDSEAFDKLAQKIDIKQEMPEEVIGRLEALRETNRFTGDYLVSQLNESEVLIQVKPEVQSNLEGAFGLLTSPQRPWSSKDIEAFLKSAKTPAQIEAAQNLESEWHQSFQEMSKELDERRTMASRMATAIENAIGVAPTAPKHCAKTLKEMGWVLAEGEFSPEATETWKAVAVQVANEINHRIEKAAIKFQQAFPKAPVSENSQVIRKLADVADLPLTRSSADILCKQGVTSLPKSEAEGRILLSRQGSDPLAALKKWANNGDPASGIQATARTLMGTEKVARACMSRSEISLMEEAPVHARVLEKLAAIKPAELFVVTKEILDELASPQTQAEPAPVEVKNLTRNFVESAQKGKLTYGEFTKLRNQATSMLEKMAGQIRVIETLNGQAGLQVSNHLRPEALAGVLADTGFGRKRIEAAIYRGESVSHGEFKPTSGALVGVETQDYPARFEREKKTEKPKPSFHDLGWGM